MFSKGCSSLVRRAGVALIASLAFWLVATTAAQAATPAFTAHGSAEQVYVLGLGANEKMSLVNRAGKTIATQNADSLGGLLFRNVPPGSGYRVRQFPAGAESAPVTVMSDRSAPPSTSIYDQTIPDNGYSYLTTRDGTQLAIDVHPPQEPAGEPGLPPGVSLPGTFQLGPIDANLPSSAATGPPW